MEKMKQKKKRKYVILSRISWDAHFNADMMSGKGFEITEPPEISIDGQKSKTLYGPQSPLYGMSYDDEKAFSERYRCRCGTFKSRIFEGETCPFCNTKVEYRDADIKIFGWYSLNDYKIINPYFYQKLCSAIGKKVFPDIINAKYKITIDGKRVRPKKGDIDDVPLSIYSGLGIYEFYNKYEEVLTYFKSIKKNKIPILDKLIKLKRKVFASHIPVPSTLLRPQAITTDSFYYQSIDKLINTTYSLTDHLKHCLDVERDYLLQRIQSKVNLMWNIYFEEINGKEKLIRGEILGGSLNYTSRDVIVPDPTLRMDELSLSYFAFRELAKYKIIYYIMKLENTTLSKAHSIWKKSASFSEKVWKIMQFIIKRDDVRILLNRNPTLNFSSMLLMKIRDIKKDYRDYSLSIPLQILPGLNADFDGDILNMILLGDVSVVWMFRKFDPVKRMIISRDTGQLNPYFVLQKGQKINLYYFATIGKKENDEPQTYAVYDNDNPEKIIYVPYEEIQNYKSGEIPVNEIPIEYLITNKANE